jgi:predicted ATPase
MLWHLGYPDQALAMSRRALALAEELSHPFTLVCVSYFAALLHRLRREVQETQGLVERVRQIAAERGFALFLAWGSVLLGWALFEQGQESRGLACLRRGTAAQQAIDVTVTRPSSLASLAQACGRVGETEEALCLLDEAIGLTDKNEERCWEAELHRLKGKLLLVQGDEAEAESCFERAIAVARRQEAKSWELRAATSLGRLWQAKGRRQEAREMLGACYGWFSEGFDTADLREARALIDALA